LTFERSWKGGREGGEEGNVREGVRSKDDHTSGHDGFHIIHHHEITLNDLTQFDKNETSINLFA
jgi:hypothetical protein